MKGRNEFWRDKSSLLIYRKRNSNTEEGHCHGAPSRAQLHPHGSLTSRTWSPLNNALLWPSKDKENERSKLPLIKRRAISENGSTVVEITRMRSWTQFCHNGPVEDLWQATQPHQCFSLNIVISGVTSGLLAIHRADTSPELVPTNSTVDVLSFV